jgi:hypothetical protein
MRNCKCCGRNLSRLSLGHYHSIWGGGGDTNYLIRDSICPGRNSNRVPLQPPMMCFREESYPVRVLDGGPGVVTEACSRIPQLRQANSKLFSEQIVSSLHSQYTHQSMPQHTRRTIALLHSASCSIETGSLGGGYVVAFVIRRGSCDYSLREPLGRYTFRISCS